MKTLILLIATIVCMTYTTSAQKIETGDGIVISLDSLDLNYIYLYAMNSGGLKPKVYVAIDYGKQRDAFESSSIIVLPTGSKKSFASEIEALNYLYTCGWEVVTMNSIAVMGGTQNRILLQRRR